MKLHIIDEWINKMSIKKHWFLRTIILLSLSIASGCFLSRSEEPSIVDFDLKRDKKALMEIFERDWHWLIPGDRDSFSPELMMEYKAPMQNPLYAGRLQLKVMRERDTIIGFVAWYMMDRETGFLNFLDVNPEYRGKGYAEKLLRYAMDDMIKKGAKKLTMVTWPHNTRARKLYDRLGWKVVKIAFQAHYEYTVER